MKLSTLQGLLAFLLLQQLCLGQQTCHCTGDACSCTDASSNATSTDALAPGNPPTGSQDFLTPSGDYQSPSTPAKPVRAANQQQYIWAGASMISSSDNAIVLVRPLFSYIKCHFVLTSCRVSQSGMLRIEVRLCQTQTGTRPTRLSSRFTHRTVAILDHEIYCFPT